MSVNLIFGSKGEGKSTYMLDIIKTSLRPCICVDSIKWTDKNTRRLVFDQYMIRIEKILDFSRIDRFKVVYTPKDDLDMAIFCDHLFLYYSINIFIDELDTWVSNKSLPPEIYNIFRFSRHRDFNIYCTMRDPTEIHRLIRGSTDYFIIYRLKEKGFLEYFKYYDPDLPDQIKALEQHKYIRYAIY